MNKKDVMDQAAAVLKKEYPDAVCSLQYKDALQLLIATRLAAQCTDARVNMVTPRLFAKFKNVYDFANADVSVVEQYVKSCGFYHTKAKDIVNMCKMIRDKYYSAVPSTMEELTQLPGIGRKTANLVLGDIFKKPAVVVDTHCIRITRRLGFHNTKDAYKIERILKELLPPEESNDFCHRLVLHGRAVCKAPIPRCNECCMSEFCVHFENNKDK